MQASQPSQALTRQIPPFVTCGDISPRPGEGGAQRRMRAQTPSQSRLAQRRAFSESGAANAAFRYDPSREKAILENPRLCSNESPSGAFKRQSGLR